MQVRHLFSPQHAVRAVQAFKSRNWSETEFLDLLGAIAEQGSISSVSPTALNALYGYFPHIYDPFVRSQCLDIMHYSPMRNPEFGSYVGLSYINSGDIEMAMTECMAAARHDVGSNAESHKLLISKLIDNGALDLRPASDDMWAKLFESCVNNDNFEQARYLWSIKPLSTTCIGEPILVRFIELIGRYRDTKLLKDVLLRTKGELPITSGAVSACITCFTPNIRELLKQIESNHDMLEKTVAIQDARFISEALVPHAMDVFKMYTEIPAFLGNILLQGFYRKHTSQTVFHVYRHMVNKHGFKPNNDSAELLANAAYRLGNSKLLSFNIWKEMHDRFGIRLSRKFYETTLMCQLVGSNYMSVRFFLAEMARQKVFIRKHIQRLVYNKFERLGNTAPLVDLGQPNLQAKFLAFDENEAASESPNEDQARSNAQLFIDGKSPHEEPLAVLSDMLAYDKARSDRLRNGSVRLAPAEVNK